MRNKLLSFILFCGLSSVGIQGYADDLDDFDLDFIESDISVNQITKNNDAKVSEISQETSSAEPAMATNKAPDEIKVEAEQNKVQPAKSNGDDEKPKEVFLPDEVAAQLPEIPAKPVAPNGNLLTKVRRGEKISNDDVEFWVYNTPDLNTCYENGQTMLLYLIKKYTNATAVQMLVDNGADLQTHCSPRYEALFVAAKYNPSAAVIETLINGGANVVERDFEKNTALIVAAAFNPAVKVINVLMDYGLKTDTVNQYGYDALRLAVYENGRLPIIQSLIDNGADVNAVDNLGRTALMAAAVRGREDVMKYLISRGADYKARDKNGLSVLDYFNQRSYLELPDFIKADENTSPSKRLFDEFAFITKMHLFYGDELRRALSADDADNAVINALEHLAAVNGVDENGCSMLINAVQQNAKISVLEKLVAAKADVNARCVHERNALMFLAMQKPATTEQLQQQIEVTQFLIKQGIDVNGVDDFGNSALVYAVGNQADNAFILSLIQAGADVNLANQALETPLWIAVRQQRAPEILQLLLENGADPNAKDLRGESPLWYLLHNKNETNAEIVKILIEGGADVNAPSQSGDFALWYALHNRLAPVIVEKIIAYQNSLDIRDENGDTPLLFAVKNEYPASVVKLLLAKGANPDLADKNGFTMTDILQGSQFFNETMQKVNRDRVLGAW